MVVLVDTAIWIDHIRRPDKDLTHLLEGEMVLIHPYVTGEIALGAMKNLALFLAWLDRLPKAAVASAKNVLDFIRRGELSGSGIGYVDAHLLVSALITPEAQLWTRDKRLHGVARRSPLLLFCRKMK